MIHFNTVSGSPFERGAASSHRFHSPLSIRFSKYGHLLENRELMDQVRKVVKRVENVFPEYIEEVRGRAAGAAIEETFYMLLMCPELANLASGCTSIVARDSSGNLILSHNEDDYYIGDEYTVTKVTLPDGSWFVTNDPDNMPFGNGFSWNSFGIVKTINYTYPMTQNTKGIPRYFGQRHITEARSLEDFVKRCSTSDRASGFHAFALDIKNGRAISVEVTDDAVSVKDIADHAIHTNHYLHAPITHGRIWADPEGNSLFRLKKSTELLRKEQAHISLQGLMRILDYQGDDIERSIRMDRQRSSWPTLVNFSIDVGEKKIYLQSYVGQTENFVFDYETQNTLN